MRRIIWVGLGLVALAAALRIGTMIGESGQMKLKPKVTWAEKSGSAGTRAPVEVRSEDVSPSPGGDQAPGSAAPPAAPSSRGDIATQLAQTAQAPERKSKRTE